MKRVVTFEVETLPVDASEYTVVVAVVSADGRVNGVEFQVSTSEWDAMSDSTFAQRFLAPAAATLRDRRECRTRLAADWLRG